MNSCLYEGTIRHRRHAGPHDEFNHRLFMVCLDLDELPELFDGHLLWSARGPAPAWFRRADYLGDAQAPLADEVRKLVAERTGRRPGGPIRLLTHMRYFGQCFNPVSFYYCYDVVGERVLAVVAEVTNTPWGERHAYVLDAHSAADHGSAAVLSGQFPKELHVSPLMGMDHVYDWHMTEPSDRLAVHIESRVPGGEGVFDATLALRRREINGRQLARVLALYPLLSTRILVRIYTHALRLRLRGARYFPHPRRGALGA